MTNSLSRNSFENELHTALTHLYDPAALRNSLLVRLFGLDSQEEAGTALRRLLVETIESLKPGEEVPPQSNAWRYYQILFNRYTEQFTQKEVANDLGLSTRQLRRQEKLALQVLADTLWIHYNLEQDQAESSPRQVQAGEANTAPEMLTPGREAELAWSQTAFPNEAVEVEALVQSALKTARPMIRSSKLHTEYTATEALPRLAVQLVPTRQALLNILTTALDWLPEGQLTISAENQPQEGHIHVSIAGSGSVSAPPPEIGGERLKVARQLVEFSDGQLEVISDGGADHVFILRLKLPTEKQITVLAIDDNPDTLQLLQRYTAGTRYRLVGESDPRQALALAAEALPDIIVLDVMLLDVDGWELLGRFRAHPKLGDRPVIVCTILPQKQLALSLGAAGFLSKPLSRQDLLSALDAQADRLY